MTVEKRKALGPVAALVAAMMLTTAVTPRTQTGGQSADDALAARLSKVPSTSMRTSTLTAPGPTASRRPGCSTSTTWPG